jgi:mRNA interferase MazF
VSQQYIPDRNDIVWLDFDPTKGKEIGKYRPTFVLSSKIYNKNTGLMICCPISTSIRGNITEVRIDCLDKPSVIAAGIVQTLSWKDRKIKHIARAEAGILDEVLCRLIPLMGGEDYCIDEHH